MLKLLVVCVIPVLVYLNSSNDKSSLSTSLTFTHLWTLDNFAHLYNENCQWKWEVDSEKFTMPNNEELKFSLQINPKKKRKDGEDYLGVGLFSTEIPTIWDGKVTVKNIFCIVDEEGNILFDKGYTESEVFKGRGTGDDKYLPVKELLDSSTGYLSRGTLRVLCEMTLYSPEGIFNSTGKKHTFSHTSIPSSVSRLSHSFTVSHFKWLTADSTRQMPLKVVSNPFAPKREDIGKMSIQFFPKGWGKDEENVKIGICNYNFHSLNVHYELFLIDANGNKCHKEENTHRFLKKSGRYHSLPRRHLLSLLDSLPTDKLTINCRVTVLLEGEQNKASSITTPTTTHIDLAFFTFHYVSFIWSIEQLNKQLHKPIIESKFFSPSSDFRYLFNLRLSPNKDSENFTCELYFIPKNSIEESKVEWKYSVVDKKGNEWFGSVYTYSISKLAKVSPSVLMPHHTLFNFASLLLPDGKLTIKCEVWIHEPLKKLPPELLNPPQAKDSGDTHFTIGANAKNIIINHKSKINHSPIIQNSTSTEPSPSKKQQN